MKKRLEQISVKEKIRLLTGDGFWRTAAVEDAAVPAVFMCDGPHGLRKQPDSADALSVYKSEISTCFPTSSAVACSWDRELAAKIGAAIGAEARAADVALVLGPGLNIKRSPLCGRNFEYYSEDPCLSGRLASEFVNGVQSTGVGACLKHFAVNNQESGRMLVDTLVDERALREIYLSGFEYAVKNSKPASIMAAYNKLNGQYCTQNKRLLTDILRNEWKYEGFVVSDWGAANDPVECVKAGMDLGMPDSLGYHAKQVAAALEAGTLDEAFVSQSAERVAEFAVSAQKRLETEPKPAADLAKHHEFAKNAEAECAVLLKNEDNILPIKSDKSVLIIGEFADKMRFQAGGSSRVNTGATPRLLDALRFFDKKFEYAAGFSVESNEPNIDLEREALNLAGKYDMVVFAGGLTDYSESEGYDRSSIDLPEAQVQLLRKLDAMGKKIVFLAFGGAPFVFPQLASIKAILHFYLGGQGVGEAAYELLFGIKNPCGRLAESYPKQLEDVPCHKYFANLNNSVELRESIFVGYRYYDTFGVPVAYCFGHGLSYTQFAYENLKVAKNNTFNYAISFTVKNVGAVAGREVVQLYVGAPEITNFIRPKRELRDFYKTPLLAPGEEHTVKFRLNESSFSYYDIHEKRLCVPSGRYTIYIGSSLTDVRLQRTAEIEGNVTPPDQSALKAYFKTGGVTPFSVPDSQFKKLLGAPLVEEKEPKRGEFTTLNTLAQMQKYSAFARMVVRTTKKTMLKQTGITDENHPRVKMLLDGVVQMPVRTIPVVSANMVKMNLINAIVAFANGKPIKGLGFLLGRKKK